MTFAEFKKAIPSIKRKMQGWPYKAIIIDGPQGPTGKTTAAKLLREQGLTVYEDWEVLHVTLDALLPEWQERGAHKEVKKMKDFFSDNWQTIVIAAATTIVVRLLLGW